MAKDQEGCRSPCPIANSLDILGDRWTLLVVRDLMFRGMSEYGQFLEAGEGISTNILADRLNRLVEQGVIERREHSTDKKRVTYVLTEKGIDLMPVLLELVLWATKHLPHVQAPREFMDSLKNHREALTSGIRRQLRATAKAGGKKTARAGRPK